MSPVGTLISYMQSVLLWWTIYVPKNYRAMQSSAINTTGLMGNGVMTVVLNHSQHLKISCNSAPFSRGYLQSIQIFLVVTLMDSGEVAKEEAVGRGQGCC